MLMLFMAVAALVCVLVCVTVRVSASVRGLVLVRTTGMRGGRTVDFMRMSGLRHCGVLSCVMHYS